FLGGTGGGSFFGDWEFPKFNWWGGSSPSSSSSSSSWNWPKWGSSSSSSSSGWGSGSGFGFGSMGAAWVPFVILLVIILAVVIWFQLKNIRGRMPAVA